MDRDLVKSIAVHLGVWAVLGLAFGIVCDRLGVSFPVYLCLWLGGAGAYLYFQAKDEQKKEQERLTALWQQAYKTGAEEALKQKS